MNINRRYKYISLNEMPRKLNIFKRIICKHEFVDDIQCGELGLTRISGEDHIVYCIKCGHIEGYYSKEYD